MLHNVNPASHENTANVLDALAMNDHSEANSFFSPVNKRTMAGDVEIEVKDGVDDTRPSNRLLYAFEMPLTDGRGTEQAIRKQKISELNYQISLI